MSTSRQPFKVWKPECEYPKGTVVWDGARFSGDYESGTTWKARRDVQPFESPRYDTDKHRPWDKLASGVKIPLTKSPCPRCDQTIRRPVNRVCHRCITAIVEDYKSMAALRSIVGASRVQVDVGAVPYFNDQDAAYGEDDLAEALQSLVQSVATPPGQIDVQNIEQLVKHHTDSRGRRHVLELPQPFLESFRVFFDQLLKYGQRRYDSGYRRGSNLLVGLATGEKSVADFNQATIDAK